MKRVLLCLVVFILCSLLCACQSLIVTEETSVITESVMEVDSSDLSDEYSLPVFSYAESGGLLLADYPNYCVFVMDWTFDGGIISASNAGLPIYPYWSDKNSVVIDNSKQRTIEYNHHIFQYEHTSYDSSNYYHVDYYRSTSDNLVLGIERETGYVIYGGMIKEFSELPDRFPDNLFHKVSPITPSYLRGGLSQEMADVLSPVVDDLISDDILSALQITLESCFEGYTIHLRTTFDEADPDQYPQCVLTPNQSIGVLYACELKNDHSSYLFVIVVPSDANPLFTLEDLLHSSENASEYYDKLEP